MPIYPYSFQLPPLNVQDIPNDGAPGEFLGINVGGALDWLPAGGGGSGDMLAANNLSELTNFATTRTNIGLGTASTPTFANLTLTSPSLSSSAPVTISQTWGTLNATYTAFKVVANEAAVANTASNMLELWSGNAATLKVKVNKLGQLIVPPGTVSAPSLCFTTDKNGFYKLTNGFGYATDTNNPVLTANYNSALGMLSGMFLGWSTDVFTQPDWDVRLYKDGAGQLALRNGAAAQRFNVYNSYLNAGVDYERMGIGDIPAIAGNVGLYYARAGSGAAKGIYIWNDSNSSIVLSTNATNRWQILNTGHLHAWTDNQFDIGASGANRPRSVYVADSLFVGSTTNIIALGSVDGGILNWNNRANIMSPSFGVIRLVDNPRTNFDRLQFGGGTNLFPAIKRNAAGLQIRLADDSANATLETGNLYASGNVGIGTTSPTSKLHVALNPAANYTTEKVQFGNVFLGNAVSNYSALWMGGISPALTLTNSNFVLASDGSGTILNSPAGSGITFQVNGTNRWAINTSGHFLTATDNTYDIGASGASRPRNVYVGSDVISRPSAAITPSNNGEFVVEATSNTTLTFKLKGTDGTVRTGTITLA